MSALLDSAWINWLLSYFLVLQVLLSGSCSRPLQQHGVNPPSKRVGISETQKDISGTGRLIARSDPPTSEDLFMFDSTLEGTLVVRDGCVAIVSLDGERWSIPVWPFGTRILAATSSIETKIDGRVQMFELGSEILVAGGHVPRDIVERIAEPGRCYGRFFLVGWP